MHTPVLLQQVIKNLEIKPRDKYIDATAGEGGHIKEILKKGCKLLAIDIDKNQIEKLKEIFKTFNNSKNLKLVCGNFSDIESISKNNDFYPADGILIDLGLSYEQLSSSKRGFSYKNLNEDLDMRLTDSFDKKAVDIINSFNELNLYEIFAKNSEEINSRTIAKNIVKSRSMKKINTVGDLVEIIDRTVKRHDTRILSRIFQAIRMEVNSELLNLQKVLIGSLNVLKEKGRLLIITFHSVEDRVVKKFIENNQDKVYQLALLKSKNDIQFERSAKLRILIKK